MKTIAKATAIGAVISLSLFLFSWRAHEFDELFIVQFPGYWISSLFWGFAGFPHYTPTHRASFLFPYVIVTGNMAFYGLIAYAFLTLSTRMGKRIH